MNFLNDLQSRITLLDKRSWYQYLAITAVFFFLLVGVILFFYYRSVSKWEQKIAEVNESRLEAKKLLDKAERVKKERTEVTALLEEDPNFKIKAYMQDVLEKVGILAQVQSENAVVSSMQDGYQENQVTYQLAGINMRQLTELLNEIEENKRVFVKELDITKSKKVPRTIDVDIRIATMMPKAT